MPYLTNEEIAAITSQDAGEPTQASPLSMAGSIGSSIQQVMNLAQMRAILNTFEQTLPSYLGKHLGFAETIRRIPLDSLMMKAYVESQIKGDWTLANSLLQTGIAQGVGGTYASLYESLTGLTLLSNSYVGYLHKLGIDPYIARWVNTTLKPNIANANSALLLWNLKQINDNQLDALLKADGWHEAWHPMLKAGWFQPPPLEYLFELYRRKAIDKENLYMGLRYHRLPEWFLPTMEKLTVVAPEPYRAAEASGRGLMTLKQVEESFQWYGLSPDQASIWTEAQRTRPSVGMLADYLWRGLINEQEFMNQIRLTGYPDGYDKIVKDALPQIPPAQDIITMVVREAFEEANIVPAGKDFSDWIAKKGFSQYWADKYWTAHFTPIPIQYAYQNLHRGLHDEEWLEEVLRIADIHPRWRKDIINVAFRPPAIRELGYGYDVGNYTRDDIIKYRRWGGLSLEDATKAADSLIDYRLEAERNTIRTANMNKFINGMITEQQFRAELKRLRTNEDAIELWVERAKLMIELKPTVTSYNEPPALTRSDAQWMYESGLRDLSWFTQALKDIGYSDSAVQAYIDQSNKKIADKAKATTAIEVKEPTLALIQDFYANKLIDRTMTLQRIIELGYTPQDAEMIVQTWEQPAQAKDKGLTLSQQIELYHQKVIDAATLQGRLISMGYDLNEAQNLIALADVTAPAQASGKQLTEGELEDLYLYGYYDMVGLTAEYVRRGYSATDAQLRTYIVTLQESLPILRAQYKNAWIGEAELAQALTQLIQPLNLIGNVNTIVANIMMTMVKNTQAERLAPERDLTKAEILKGAKNLLISPDQAIELLVTMGYTADEALYLLKINGIVAYNDPKGYWDMRQAVEFRNKALRMPYTEIPNELIELETQLQNVTKSIRELKADPAKVTELSIKLGELGNIEANMKMTQGRLRKMPAKTG